MTKSKRIPLILDLEFWPRVRWLLTFCHEVKNYISWWESICIMFIIRLHFSKDPYWNISCPFRASLTVSRRILQHPGPLKPRSVYSILQNYKSPLFLGGVQGVGKYIPWSTEHWVFFLKAWMLRYPLNMAQESWRRKAEIILGQCFSNYMWGETSFDLVCCFHCGPDQYIYKL